MLYNCMRQGIKKGSQAAIDSRHARVENRPLELTDDGEQMLPKPGGRKGKMGSKKIPSFGPDGTPKKANQPDKPEKPLTPAEKLRRSAEEMGRRFDKITKDAKKAGDSMRKETERRASSRENVNIARLGLAEKILSELYSGTGRAVKKDMVKTIDKKIRKQLDKPAKMGKETARVQSNIDALYKKRRKLKPEDAGYDPLP